MIPVSERSAKLRDELKSCIKGKAAIVGIGNIIRGDDGLGPKLISILRERKAQFTLFDCGTAPENYIIPILSSDCDTVILVDATDIGEAPGEIRVIGLDQISTISFSTHNPSPRLFTDLLRTGKDNLHIFVVSIQPKDTSLGKPLSSEVLESIDTLAKALSETI